jgi:pSer/pThr/pTyr-binding forkhead associated (FHA) protein
MSDKPLWSAIGKLWGNTRPGQGRTGKSATTCPKGHPMDPSWTSCPVCRAESRSQERTSADALSMQPKEDDQRRPAMSRSPTITPGSAPDPDPNRTRIDTGTDSSAPSPRRQGAVRRMITGVLVTYTWERQGELFILYEGRNVIGKGEVASEGGRPCDVLLRSDATMSNEHAMILYRHGRYQLFDQRSTNGTFADGEFVESAGVELADGAKIKTGETVWLFRKILPDQQGAGPARTHRDEPDEPDDRPHRDHSRVL